MEKESKSVGLEKEDALNGTRWRVDVGEIAVRVGLIRPPLFTGINPDQNWTDDDDHVWISITITIYCILINHNGKPV